MSVLLTPRSAGALSSLSFDTALFVVSDCLSEAQCCAQNGNAHKARLLYRLAERYALKTGYTELLRLVWTYEEAEEP